MSLPPPEPSIEFPSPPYPLPVKHASLESLFNVSYWLWRLNPSSIFPVILSSAVDVLKQSIIVVTLIVGLMQLAATGVLRMVAESIGTGDLSRLVLTLLPVVPTIIIVAAVSVFFFFLASILAGGFLNSAEYGSYLRLLQKGSLSTVDVFEEMRLKWVKMAWTVLVVETIKILPMLVVLASILADALSLLSGNPEASTFVSRVFLWLGFAIVAFVFMMVLTVLTVYAYPAAADGAYGFSAVRKSMGTCLRLPANTVAYCILRVLSVVSITIITFLAGLLGFRLSSIATVILSFLVTPVFHIFKTMIFLKGKPEPFVTPLPVGPPISKDVFSYVLNTGLERVKKGLSELVDFLAEPKNMFFHFSSAIAFSLGVMLGKQLSSSGIRQIVYSLGYVPGKATTLFEAAYGLPFLALDISFHNWQVSLATALSGIIFIVPVLATLVFNGFILGVVEDIVQSLAMFLAAILPHGVIELPAFLIAGSAGLSLGIEFFKALKKRSVSSDAEFHSVLKRTVYIVLGLIPVFIVAGVIETFVTPFIMRLYGWR
ncbi:MAG: stage II sporulation protein M [Crenarchaeota archaeon]|nr:stage II sporulation protein M [Thermoproteota archaeon]